jgi:transketolase
MPSMERFEDQPEAYHGTVLPPYTPTVAVETGTTRDWHHLVGDDGDVVGLDRPVGRDTPSSASPSKMSSTPPATD